MLTFESAMAAKAASGQCVTDAQWYVAVVAAMARNIEGLCADRFLFSIDPPNPEIMSYFDERLPPHEAAIELFSTRH